MSKIFTNQAGQFLAFVRSEDGDVFPVAHNKREETEATIEYVESGDNEFWVEIVTTPPDKWASQVWPVNEEE